MVLKMTISKAWAMDFVWSSVGNFFLYAKFSLSSGIQHGVLNIRSFTGKPMLFHVPCGYGAYSRTCTLSSKATYGGSREKGGLLSPREGIPISRSLSRDRTTVDTRWRWLPP